MELVELNSPHNNYSIHRELPVDVPDSFVGVVKQTPRYPPPHPPPQPPQRFSTLEHQQLALNNRINSEKIRKYSDEIYHKKEEEEFLRSSIRGSKKLQQLIERNHAEPMVNIAFEPDDEVLVAYNNNTYGSIIPARRERESDKGRLTFVNVFTFIFSSLTKINLNLIKFVLDNNSATSTLFGIGRGERSQ